MEWRGELGIWPRHAPLLTRLKPGLLRIVIKEELEQPFFVPSGVIEVQPHVVTVLADTVVRSDEFDEAAARASLVVEKKTGHVDYMDAELKLNLALLRAMDQIRKSNKHKSF